ncbi:MAG TPA: NifU family protein [Blastocatellia bacterium]|nr:NifU family protein [Blastocatellia bacterium]
MSSPFADQIQIRAQVDNNDINVCRFTVDRPVHEGSAVFENEKEAKKNGLAEKLFNIPGVTKVELAGEVVTVTKTGYDDWRSIGKRIGAAIRSFLNPRPEVAEGEALPPDVLRAKVQEILDEQINPGVATHGGFVELLDVQGNDVFIRMGGGCQGCGAADMTLKMGIERIIREVVPQIGEIYDTTDHAAGRNPYYAPQK